MQAYRKAVQLLSRHEQTNTARAKIERMNAIRAEIERILDTPFDSDIPDSFRQDITNLPQIGSDLSEI